MVATLSFFAITPQIVHNDSARADGPVGSGGENYYAPAHHRAAKKHRISKVSLGTAAPASAIVAGGTYSWPYSVTNAGPVPAKQAVFTAVLSPWLRLVTVSQQCRSRPANQLACGLGTLGNGQTRIGMVTARVASNAPVGTLVTSPVTVSWRNTPEQRTTTGSLPGVVVAAPSPARTAAAASPTPSSVVTPSASPSVPAAASPSASPSASAIASPSVSPSASAVAFPSVSPSGTAVASPSPSPVAKTRRAGGSCVVENARGLVCQVPIPAPPQVPVQPARTGAPGGSSPANLALTATVPSVVRAGQSIPYQFTVTHLGATTALTGAPTVPPAGRTRRATGQCAMENGHGLVCEVPLPAQVPAQPAKRVALAPETTLALSAAVPAVVRSGETIPYRFTVTNVGPATARALVLSSLPTGWPLAKTRRAAGACVAANGRGYVCRLPVLAPGERHTFAMSAGTKLGMTRNGTVRCMAAVTSSGSSASAAPSGTAGSGRLEVTCSTRVLGQRIVRTVETGSQLPLTGSASLVMAAVALNALIVGAFFICMGRPRRHQL